MKRLSSVNLSFIAGIAKQCPQVATLHISELRESVLTRFQMTSSEFPLTHSRPSSVEKGEESIEGEHFHNEESLICQGDDVNATARQ